MTKGTVMSDINNSSHDDIDGVDEHKGIFGGWCSSAS
jgi:hypothetical protein